MTHARRVHVRRSGLVAPLGVLVFLLAPIPLAAADVPEKPTARPTAPAATVPTPKTLAIAQLPVPCWGCPEGREWPIAFRTDLDLLAPLGNGPANAGLFWKDFAKPGGPRLAEATAALERRVAGPGDFGRVLPPDDPLLLEAEPWCDQATMRFYPDFFPLRGYDTQLPNLLVPLNVAKSWVARGIGREDPARAMEDFRRAIRLGRLLRQKDTTIVTDLVGLACIRLGAEGVHELARKRGDAPLALLAATVLGEHAPQRLFTQERVAKVDVKPWARETAGAWALALPDERFGTLVEMAKGEPELRFRGEAILTLSVVRVLGTPEQRERALATLKELAASKDTRVAALASRNLASPPSLDDVFRDRAPAAN
jgi:hypothetical protein